MGRGPDAGSIPAGSTSPFSLDMGPRMDPFWTGFEKLAVAWSDALKKAKILKPRKPPKPGPTLNYAEIAKEAPGTPSVPMWKKKLGENT